MRRPRPMPRRRALGVGKMEIWTPIELWSMVEAMQRPGMARRMPAMMAGMTQLKAWMRMRKTTPILLKPTTRRTPSSQVLVSTLMRRRLQRRMTERRKRMTMIMLSTMPRMSCPKRSSQSSSRTGRQRWMGFTPRSRPILEPQPVMANWMLSQLLSVQMSILPGMLILIVSEYSCGSALCMQRMNESARLLQQARFLKRCLDSVMMVLPSWPSSNLPQDEVKRSLTLYGMNTLLEKDCSLEYYWVLLFQLQFPNPSFMQSQCSFTSEQYQQKSPWMRMVSPTSTLSWLAILVEIRHSSTFRGSYGYSLPSPIFLSRAVSIDRKSASMYRLHPKLLALYFCALCSSEFSLCYFVEMSKSPSHPLNVFNPVMFTEFSNRGDVCLLLSSPSTSFTFVKFSPSMIHALSAWSDKIYCGESSSSLRRYLPRAQISMSVSVAGPSAAFKKIMGARSMMLWLTEDAITTTVTDSSDSTQEQHRRVASCQAECRQNENADLIDM